MEGRRHDVDCFQALFSVRMMLSAAPGIRHFDLMKAAAKYLW